MTERRFTLHPHRDDIRQNCVEAIDALPRNKKWEVTIEPYKKSRSSEANRYYWGVVVRTLSQHCGYTESEMHDELLGSYFGWEKRQVRGHVREFPRRRTTSPDVMDKLDFMGLTQLGQQIAAELGVRLPDILSD